MMDIVTLRKTGSVHQLLHLHEPLLLIDIRGCPRASATSRNEHLLPLNCIIDFNVAKRNGREGAEVGVWGGIISAVTLPHFSFFTESVIRFLFSGWLGSDYTKRSDRDRLLLLIAGLVNNSWDCRAQCVGGRHFLFLVFNV